MLFRSDVTKADSVNGLAIEMADGKLRELSVDIDATTFKNTRDLATAINLAKQNENRTCAELFLHQSMAPTLDKLDSVSMKNDKKLVFKLKDGTTRSHKIKIENTAFESVEAIRHMIDRAIYNEKWRQHPEPEIAAA